MRRRLLVAPVALAFISAVAAAAPAHTTKLTYSRGPGAADCPDVDVIRAGVAARLGYEPFDEHAQRIVSATVNRTGRVLEARIQIGGADGKAVAERKLSSRQSDCLELASAMELAISIAIDPMVVTRAAPAPPHPPTPPPQPPAPPPLPAAPAPAAAVAARPASPASLEAGVGVQATVGSAPGPAMGLAAWAGLRWPRVSISVEGRADFAGGTAQSAGAAPGRVEASLLLGGFVPCVHRGAVLACAILAAGALQGTGVGVAEPRKETTLYVAAGARIGARVHVAGPLSVGAHLDLLGTPTRTALRIDDRDVWTTPPLSAAFGVGFFGTFL